MSDDIEKPDTESPDDSSGGPVCGERLAEARRELQIPVLEIAKELHLDEYKVRALENNEFDVIGAPVFAKGHLRKFAQLVRVSEADVMADYYELTRASDSLPALSLRPRQKQALSLSPGPWLVLIFVGSMIAFAYWWFALREVAPDTPEPGETAPVLQEEQSRADDNFVEILDEADATEEPVAVALPAVVEQQEISEPVQETVPDTDGLRLQISYSGECWTEISDARGERLFFDLGRAGRTVNLSGEAPFNVLFGNAANVSVRVNGVDYQLPPPDARGTARLTITGP